MVWLLSVFKAEKAYNNSWICAFSNPCLWGWCLYVWLTLETGRFRYRHGWLAFQKEGDGMGWGSWCFLGRIFVFSGRRGGGCNIDQSYKPKRDFGGGVLGAVEGGVSWQGRNKKVSVYFDMEVEVTILEVHK